MSEDEDRPKSWLQRFIWNRLDRMADRIQDADIEEDPDRWTANEVRVHDRAMLHINLLSAASIAIAGATAIVFAWLAVTMFWERSYLLLAYDGIMCVLTGLMCAKYIREGRKDRADMAGARAEMIATFNQFKERRDGSI